MVVQPPHYCVRMTCVLHVVFCPSYVFMDATAKLLLHELWPDKRTKGQTRIHVFLRTATSATDAAVVRLSVNPMTNTHAELHLSDGISQKN
jgi:hypothetical protein